MPPPLPKKKLKEKGERERRTSSNFLGIQYVIYMLSFPAPLTFHVNGRS
jgi:hypothetical protein